MMIIVLLLGASLTLALGFLVAFLMSAKEGQFDDSVTPAMRMLHDDEPIFEHQPGPALVETASEKETTL